MITHTHLLDNFKFLKPQNVPGFGWAVVGRKTHNAKSFKLQFAIVATKAYGQGFAGEEEATEALQGLTHTIKST